MKIKPMPPQAYLRSILDYDPQIGNFRWHYRDDMPRIWNCKCAGKIAGARQRKARSILIDKQAYYAHRLAWVYVYGDTLTVDMQVDHKDCDGHNNAIANLRLATHGQNGSNSRGWGKKKLPKGVSRMNRGKPYRARIGVNGKVEWLGVYDTVEEAHAAYVAAARRAKGEFARAE